MHLGTSFWCFRRSDLKYMISCIWGVRFSAFGVLVCTSCSSGLGAMPESLHLPRIGTMDSSHGFRHHGNTHFWSDPVNSMHRGEIVMLWFRIHEFHDFALFVISRFRMSDFGNHGFEVWIAKWDLRSTYLGPHFGPILDLYLTTLGGDIYSESRSTPSGSPPKGPPDWTPILTHFRSPKACI